MYKRLNIQVETADNGYILYIHACDDIEDDYDMNSLHVNKIFGSGHMGSMLDEIAVYIKKNLLPV